MSEAIELTSLIIISNNIHGYTNLSISDNRRRNADVITLKWNMYISGSQSESYHIKTVP